MWFRRDLRLEDNSALSRALKKSEPLFLLFHVNPEQFVKGPSKNETAFFSDRSIFSKRSERSRWKASSFVW